MLDNMKVKPVKKGFVRRWVERIVLENVMSMIPGYVTEDGEFHFYPNYQSNYDTYINKRIEALEVRFAALDTRIKALETSKKPDEALDSSHKTLKKEKLGGRRDRKPLK